MRRPTAVTWQVGVAAVDITPDYPVRLSGYGSRRDVNKGVAQHMFAKALAIGSDEEGPAVLVTVDNVGVPAAMRDEVLGRLSAKTKVRDERFAIASSHTHCAPMLAGVVPNLFSMDIPAEHVPAIERYTRELTDKIEQVALAALADRQPAQLAWGVGRVGFAANRRGLPLKPVDHDLPVLRVTGADGKVRAIFTSYACHCTTLSIDAIHGDWAGCAQEALQREFPGAVALTALGCGADQNPHPRRTVELVQQHGEAVAAEAKRLLAQRTRSPSTENSTAARSRSNWPTTACRLARSGRRWPQSESVPVAYHARKNLARLDRGEEIPTQLPYLVQTWTFGNELAMVFLPGEIVVDYSLRLKREFDRTRLWVNGYSNDVPCYIPSRRVLEEGGYEGAVRDGLLTTGPPGSRPTSRSGSSAPCMNWCRRSFSPGQIACHPRRRRLPSPIPITRNCSSCAMLSGNERPVKNAADWAERAAHIRANMQQVMGLLHDTARWAPLDVEVVWEERTRQVSAAQGAFHARGRRPRAGLAADSQRVARQRQGARHAVPASDDRRSAKTNPRVSAACRRCTTRMNWPSAAMSASCPTILRSASTPTTFGNRARITPAAP